MTGVLTRRESTWHFVRRVNAAYATIDPRGVIRRSTRIKVAQDRGGRRAARIAQGMNDDLSDAGVRSSAALLGRASRSATRDVGHAT